MSTSDREIEIKRRLGTAADADRLAAALGTPREDIAQENAFLDTPDRRLRHRRWALRIRRETSRDTGAVQVVLTVKGPASQAGAAVVRTEHECVVPPEVWALLHRTELAPDDLPFPPVARLAEVLDLAGPLTRLLAFTNRRRLYDVDLAGHAVELALDETRFATGEVDHEVEIELTTPELIAAEPEITAALEAMLAAQGIPAGPPAQGKLSRALEYQP
jgi:inorganic triphosphatase YgiF